LIYILIFIKTYIYEYTYNKYIYIYFVQIVKGFAASGNHLDILSRCMELYIDTSAYSMSKGDFQLCGATQAIRASDAQVSVVHDSVVALLASSLSKSSEVITFFEVYELLHMGQTYCSKTWFIAQPSSSWLMGDDSKARLGYIERILQVGRAMYLYVVLYDLKLSEHWDSPTILHIHDDVLKAAKTEVAIYDINSLAISCLKVRNGESQVRLFQVQRSSS